MCLHMCVDEVIFQDVIQVCVMINDCILNITKYHVSWPPDLYLHTDPLFY